MRIFIVNPVSGNGKAKAIVPLIEEHCIEKGIDYVIVYTKKEKEVTSIVKQLTSTNNIIYSVGGDGTLSEVINGLNENVMFSLIPAGTGNDFYKSIKNIEDDIIDIDLGLVNNYKFINSASIGLDADIAEHANLLKKKTSIPSSLTYYLSIINRVIKYKPYEIIRDDEKKLITLLAICNGGYYGGGINIAPNAIINDGLFDVITCSSVEKKEIPGVFMKLLKHNHLEEECITEERLRSLVIDTSNPVSCNIDGEIIYDNHFEFNIKKNAIKFYNRDDLDIKRLLKK